MLSEDYLFVRYIIPINDELFNPFSMEIEEQIADDILLKLFCFFDVIDFSFHLKRDCYFALIEVILR